MEECIYGRRKGCAFECRLEGRGPRKCILPKHRRERNLAVCWRMPFCDAVLGCWVGREAVARCGIIRRQKNMVKHEEGNRSK